MSKTSNSLPSWREIAVPHEDVQRGTFQQAEFAADLSRVHAGKATAEYQDAELFFARTYVTEGMRLLLGSVIERITGQGGDPVIQLQTAFGGGKTHTLLAVYHMAKGEVAAHTIDALKPVLREQGVKQLPAARVAVLDGIQLAPDQPAVMDGIKVNTLWGQLAWQLGGAKAYALVKESDHSGTSPGKDLLAEILHQHGPCIILIDELVAYVRQFEEGQRYKGGTYDSNLSFMQALMEAVRAVPNAVLLASLPESDKEAGGARGVQALRALEHYFQRLQAVWKAVSSEESFEIVRRRLFQGIQDQEAVREVCRAFAKYHQKEKDELPQEVRNERYTTSMEQAYPIHPELFERLYVDWSTLENFQRTRGVLKLMAKVIHRLWKDGNNDPLIMPGNLPLYDGDVRNELLNYLPAGWDPVLERDIDGDRSEPWAIESGDARLGKVHAARRVARTIFLGSAPSPNEQTARGLPLDRVLLGAGVPGGSLGAYKDALRRMAESLHHLNTANDRYWYDTRPNLRREMESRKQRFDAVHDILPVVKDKLQAAIGNAYGLFTGTHVFTPSSDIMDDGQLRLVVLHPQHGHVSTGPSKALDEAQQILRLRGEQPRLYQNRLIFLAADQNTVERLYDQVRTMLAWKSIVTDYKDTRIVLDNLMARNADESFAQSRDALKRTVVDCFKYLLVPSQVLRGDDRPGDVQWEAHRLSSTAPSMIQEIERQLKENEHLIFEWAPVHLERILRKLFWKDEVDEVKAMDVWQAMLRYLY
ncbi:MAG: ATP-binding protein, partial [Flavobacteriales bacterium]|nr:ATP-binding protein [Flavobacteriales bacterium]